MQVRSDRHRASRAVQDQPGHTVRAGFTLIELLLTVVLMLLLLGAAVFNFSSLQRNVALDEGCMQIEGLLRFARAHAIGTGRTVQLIVPDIAGDTTPGANSLLQLLTEADPIANPGLYSVVQEAVTYTQEIGSRVKIIRVQQQFSEAPAPVAGQTNLLSFPGMPAAESAAPEKEQPSVTETSEEMALSERLDQSVFFFADGTSDSVEIVVASQENEDPRKLIIELVGVTGIPRRRAAMPIEESREGNTNAETLHPPGAVGKDRRP